MKKKVIAAAVAATLGHTAANAVSVNPDGLGQVLLFPYYTVQGDDTASFDTLITIVNTRDEVKAVKLRFREAKNSREVLDFNIYLSPFDVWVGVVTAATDDSGESVAVIKQRINDSGDTTCTVPVIPDTVGQPFRNLTYSGDLADGGGTGLDRTKEGYIEAIEMGVVHDGGGFDFAAAATHNETMFPADCAALNTAWAGGEWDRSNGATNVTAPTGGLFGTASLINVNEGTDYGYDATALRDFFIPNLASQNLHNDPSNQLPVLSNVFPKTSVVVQGNQIVVSEWGLFGVDPVDPVSAVLMKSTIMNDYVTEKGIQAATSLVYTMPTKHFYTDLVATAKQPFTSVFSGGAACEELKYQFWDRDEKTEVPKFTVDFSPAPQDVIPPDSLCFEANIVRINGTDALNSKLATNDLATKFENGWLRANFASDARHIMVEDGSADGSARTYHGLPVIGFSVERYFNGTLEANSTLSNYGGLFSHKSNTVISS